MNKKILISTNIAIYIVIIFLSCYFIMIPNIKKLNETNKTKVYTNEERVNLINETNRKYDELEKQKSNEYIDKKTEIQNKYDKLNEEVKTKYANKEAAKEIGLLIAKKAAKKNITEVVFDRGGYIYHGVVKELAEAAREGGLKF